MSGRQESNPSTESLECELWRVWRTINKLPIDDPLSPSDLSAHGKKLLEAAIVGKRITELEVGISLWGLEQTFNDSMKDWKREKLHWACQVFLAPDGSLIPKKEAIEFRNLLKRYCDENSINLKDLETEYLQAVTTLAFFPVYDWLFFREMKLKEDETELTIQKSSSSVGARTSENVEQTKETPLASFLKDIYDGSKTLLFIVAILVVGGGVKYCVNDHFRNQRGESDSLLTKTAMVHLDINEGKVLYNHSLSILHHC